MRAWGSLVVVTVCLTGCEAPITNVCPSFTVERSLTVEAIDRIDLLVVIDDSPSMAEEQPRIAGELADIVRALATSDLDGDGTRDVDGYRGVRVGVVRTSMNGGGGAGCTGDIETGMLVNTSDRAGCPTTFPGRVFTFRPGDPRSADELASDVGCIAAVGTHGCGIEQPLDAMRSALDTPGFHRDDAVLAVIIVTDEDDCSHALPLVGNAEDPSDGCHAETLPVTRYVSDLLRHEPVPSRIVVSVIAGVPPELADSSYDGLLADPAMQEVLDGDALVPSCSSGVGRATPPRRLVSWLAALEDARIQTNVQSICAPAFLSVLDNLLPRIRGDFQLGLCLPRALAGDAAGLVACVMEILLPSEDDGVTPTTCEAAGPEFFQLEPERDAVTGEPRERCLVPQLLGSELGIRAGWAYDDWSAEAFAICESRPRLGISRLDSFHRVTFSVRCEQPLPDGAPTCGDAG